MTSGMGGYAPPSTMSGAGSATDQSTMDTAKEQAAGLGQAAMETGGRSRPRLPSRPTPWPPRRLGRRRT